MNYKYKKMVDDLINNLRDIQSATVEYLYKRMYNEGQMRMLVADEVGLGKTWIAKGLIAKAYENWCRQNDNSVDTCHSEQSEEPKGEKRSFNIYYICSNQQLAAQNLSKLNFTKDSECIVSRVNRISLLALKPSHEEMPVKIYSLTPDTSFNTFSMQGIKEERYIIYKILKENASELFEPESPCNDGLSELLKGSYDIIWEPNPENIDLRDGIAKAFVEKLNETVSKESLPKTFEICLVNNDSCEFKSLLEQVVNKWEVINQDQESLRKVCNEVIGTLRSYLTDVCLEQMNADIFIMDEFQRFSQLLETENADVMQKRSNEQKIIARKVFSQKGARILMLSATPFKAFTNRYDESQGEHHFSEFTRVLKFLYDGADVQDGWKKYEEARKRLFSFMLNVNRLDDKDNCLDEIIECKKIVEDFYFKVIVRTEKIMASKDPDAMIDGKAELLSVSKEDINDFVCLDNLFRKIYENSGEHAPVPIDYFKSAPYAMSFLRDYKVGAKAEGVNIPTRSLGCIGNAFVDADAIHKYEFPKGKKRQKVEWPNAKLRTLMNASGKGDGQGLEKESLLLWCPPSMPYYPMEGAFKNQERFTKTLVFSAWKLVPRMIATLVSYEAEKHTLGKLRKNDNKIKYFVDKRSEDKGDNARKPARRLVFRKGRNMTTLLLAYPGKYIAGIIDPLGCIGKEDCTLDSVVRANENKIKEEIRNFCSEYGNENDYESTHISWSYPILRDKDEKEKNCNWFDRRSDDNKEISELLKGIFADNPPPSFPKNPSEDELQRQSRLMVWLSLGSPAVCAYRALSRYYDDKQTMQYVAFRIGMSFIELFNKPESIAVVDLSINEKIDYWQKVIRYCAHGNLQAVLDEYLFMLRNDNEDIKDIAEIICRVVSTRTAQLRVDNKSSFFDEKSSSRHYMRTHYAAAFGINTRKSESGEVRAANIREAFNSPFRPFVLATTSVGQEGLDFHWYCRRIMHWNLPNSPVDFEQREGRINRFRGKVIRQRVADSYKKRLSEEPKQQPWDAIFEYAKEAKHYAKFKCDIVPNWHFDTNDSHAVKIERIVPLHKFSDEIERYLSMKRVLGLYRLTFGQPRQEELVEALGDVSLDKDRLLIDLCPLKRRRQGSSQMLRYNAERKT